MVNSKLPEGTVMSGLLKYPSPKAMLESYETCKYLLISSQFVEFQFGDYTHTALNINVPALY
jgi:hypothetical protein